MKKNKYINSYINKNKNCFIKNSELHPRLNVWNNSDITINILGEDTKSNGSFEHFRLLISK